MKVGIPREVKNNEFRVAITPAGVHELVRGGHEVVVEQSAGLGSSITDEEYTAAGARILDTADEVWATADLLLKVKEPVAEEYHRMRKGQTLFTYLHLAASRACTDALLESGTTAIAYETVETANRALPLLAPMSEVAGRIAPQVGAYHLMRSAGGRGVLPAGVPGVAAARAVVIGGGVSGWNAAQIAIGMGFHVTLLDKDINKLREADRIFGTRVQTIASNAFELEKAVLEADLVIGAVLIPGAKAPKLVTNELVVPDEAGKCPCRHRDRPGRLLRGLPPHHPRRADLRGPRLGLLLRREHARRGAEHLHPRAHQRDAPVHRGTRQPRLAGRAAPGRRAGQGAQHP
ncbi:hypothetical protein SANTM175S_07411 [Streptomyces antimycoticus]